MSRVACGFSPDGQTLAITSRKGPVRLLETGPPSCTYKERAVAHRAQILADALIDRHAVTRDAADALRADAAIPPDVQAAAIRVIENRGDDATELNSRAWMIVKRPGELPALYHRALRQAQVADELRPHNGPILNTLAGAFLRCDRFAEALDTARRADSINPTHFGKPLVSDAAFLAIALARLDREADARAALAQAQTRADVSPLSEEDRDILAEAQRAVREAFLPN